MEVMKQKLKIDKNKGGTILESKQRLRSKILSMLKSLSCDEVQEKTEVIHKKLNMLEPFKKAKVIMAFWPLAGEPDIRSVIGNILDEGKKVVLPRINGKDIEAYEYVSEESLLKNQLGVYEPIATKEIMIDGCDIDVVLVPGVAFDESGRRMGRGKGYYDRFLTKLSSKVYTIGVCFDIQIQKDLPYIPSQDQSVNIVISG